MPFFILSCLICSLFVMCFFPLKHAKTIFFDTYMFFNDILETKSFATSCFFEESVLNFGQINVVLLVR